MHSIIAVILLGLCPIPTFGQIPANAPINHTAATKPAESDAIRQLEADFLDAERTTNPGVLDRVLSDDFVGISSNGHVPDKAQLLKAWQSQAGHAPSYRVETSDMQVFVLSDTAVAVYVKTYTANGNGNVAQEHKTDVFVKDRGAWKLRISDSCFPKAAQ